MGRWVRWFGVEGEAGEHGVVNDRDAVTVSVMSGPVDIPAEGPAEGGVRVVSLTGTAERMLRHAPPAPTGIISIERLSAEMLTAVLVKEGAISPDEEHKSLQEHRATGRPVEEILLDKEVMKDKVMEETELVSVLSRSCKVPYLSLEGYEIRPEVLDTIPGEFARANRVIPVERLGKTLNVATSNPLDIATFGRLREETGLNVKPALASPHEIAECLKRFYPAPPEPALEEPPVEPDEEPAELLSEDEAAAFYRSPSGAVYAGWEEEVGAGVYDLGGELVAVPVSADEFALFAADGSAPAPPAAPEGPPADPTAVGEPAEAERGKGGRARSARSEKSAKTRSKKKKKGRKRSRKKKRSGR